MNLLQSILSAVTDALLPMVVAGLLFLLAWSLVVFGGFVREALRRPRSAARLERRLAAARAAGASDAAAVLDHVELRLARRVDAVAITARLGPMFGLAGTLIPL